MLISDYIRRAVFSASPGDWNSVTVDVSPEVFDAVAHETGAEITHPAYSGPRRLLRLKTECGIPFEVWDMSECIGDQAYVFSQNVIHGNDRLCRSNHERLLFDARLEELLNDRLLAMTPDEALKEAQAKGEDTAAFAQRMNEFVRGQG